MAGKNTEQLDEYPGTGPIGSGALFHARRVSDGTDYRVPSERMPGNSALAPNRANNNTKAVKWLTNADREAAGGTDADGETAEDSFPLHTAGTNPLNLGTVFRAESGLEGVLVYDDGTNTDPAIPRLANVFRDGGQTVAGQPAKLVLVDSVEALYAGIREITDPMPAPRFHVGEIGTFTLASVEGFYRFKGIPASEVYHPPTGPDSSQWRQVAPPVSPFALVQAIPIQVAVNMDDDLVAVEGRRYLVDFLDGRVVEILPTPNGGFSQVGILNGRAVAVDIHTGYTEVTGPEVVNYSDLAARWAARPPLAGKLYVIANRGGNDVAARFDDITQWVAGGVGVNVLIARGAVDTGASGSWLYDFGNDYLTSEIATALSNYALPNIPLETEDPANATVAGHTGIEALGGDSFLFTAGGAKSVLASSVGVLGSMSTFRLAASASVPLVLSTLNSAGTAGPSYTIQPGEVIALYYAPPNNSPLTGSTQAWRLAWRSSPTKTADDIEITDLTKGVIQRSPNGTRWRLAVSNTGVVTATLA